MLGADVTKFFAQINIEVLEINRSGLAINPKNDYYEFDILKDPISELFSRLQGIEYLINCSGLIKHKIDEKDISSVQGAIQVNSAFPLQLAEFAEKSGIKIIHIGTDCVYSGEIGNYKESDLRDPKDVYGITKLLGEAESSQVMIMRSSIVGRELSAKVEFLEWVLSQPKGAMLRGFQNHLWNGLSTLHFAKIVAGIISENGFKSGRFHIVPSNSASKAEMIELTTRNFGRNDIQISKVDGPTAINRVLATNFPDENLRLWQLAGYPKPLAIAEIFSEYAVWSQKEGL